MSTAWNIVRTGPLDADGSFYASPDSPGWTGYAELLVSGTAAGSGVLRIDQAGTLQASGHLQVNGQLPAAAAGSAAGGSPPAPVLLTGTNDNAGTLTFGTGSAPSAGQLVLVTFATAWSITGGGAPHIVIAPENAATASLVPFVGVRSVTQFSFNTVNAPAASQANTVYSFSYVVIG